jgi:hypothetical protein
VRSRGGGQSTGREGESNLSALYELIGKQKRIPGSSREVDWVIANSGVVTCPQVPYSGKSVYEWNLSDKKVAFAADEDREQNLRPCKGQFCLISFRNCGRGPFVLIPLFVSVLSTMTKQ